jgi:hypothetical protein
MHPLEFDHVVDKAFTIGEGLRGSPAMAVGRQRVAYLMAFRSAGIFWSWRQKTAGKRSPYCRRCRATYAQAHYTANRQVYIDGHE